MKKVLSFSLALIMAMALAGCSDTPTKDGGFGEPPGVREDMSVWSGEPTSGGADMPEVSGTTHSDESTQKAQEDENTINVQAKIVDWEKIHFISLD